MIISYQYCHCWCCAGRCSYVGRTNLVLAWMFAIITWFSPVSVLYQWQFISVAIVIDMNMIISIHQYQHQYHYRHEYSCHDDCHRLFGAVMAMNCGIADICCFIFLETPFLWEAPRPEGIQASIELDDYSCWSVFAGLDYSSRRSMWSRNVPDLITRVRSTILYPEEQHHPFRFQAVDFALRLRALALRCCRWRHGPSLPRLNGCRIQGFDIQGEHCGRTERA